QKLAMAGIRIRQGVADVENQPRSGRQAGGKRSSIEQQCGHEVSCTGVGRPYYNAAWCHTIKPFDLHILPHLYIYVCYLIHGVTHMKRIVLYLMTNLAVLVVLSLVMNIFGVGRYLHANGLDVQQLLIFSAVIGFAGSGISLLISKWMAKTTTGARVIDPQAPASQAESWLLDTVHQLADRAGIGRPEVAIYDGAPNAFATGAFKNDALVAVSTGLLQS